MIKIVPHWDHADFLHWFREARPEVILTLHSDILSWIRDAALSKSTHVALLDRHAHHKDFAGIDQRHEAIGVASVDLVAARLLGSETGPANTPQIVSVNGAWVHGPSAPGPSRARRRSTLSSRTSPLLP